jgi:hypothetical protein
MPSTSHSRGRAVASTDDALLTPELLAHPSVADLGPVGTSPDEVENRAALEALRDRLVPVAAQLDARLSHTRNMLRHVRLALGEEAAEEAVAIDESRLRELVRFYLMEFGVGVSPSVLFRILTLAGVRLPFKSQEGLTMLCRRVRLEIERAAARK